MVATTTTQALRYPQLADRPCDWDLHLGYLAGDIDAKLTSHDADLERTIRPPLVLARQSAPHAYPASGTWEVLQFDSVDDQLGGVLARPAANNTLLRMPRTGYYQIGLHWYVNADEEELVGFTPTQMFRWQLWRQSPLATATQTQILQSQKDARLNGERGTVSGMMQVTSTLERFYWTLVLGGNYTLNETITVNSLTFYAFWVSDL